MRYAGLVLIAMLAGCTTGLGGNVTGSTLGADNAAVIKALATDKASWCLSASNPLTGPIKVFRAGEGVTYLKCDQDAMTVGTALK